MATVLMPIMRRRYNPNPRGSATTTVTMKANNPFESRTHLTNAIPGMSGLGAGSVAAAPAPAAAPATGFDWASLTKTIAETGVQVGGSLAQNEIIKRYGQLPAPSAVALPTQTNMRMPPPASPWLPYAILGGAVVVAGGIMFMLRKKRR